MIVWMIWFISYGCGADYFFIIRIRCWFFLMAPSICWTWILIKKGSTGNHLFTLINFKLVLFV